MSCGPQMPAMPLSLVKAGETVRVSRVKGNEDMKHHLKDLGFVEGSEIHVVSSSGANHRHGAGRSLWHRFQGCHAHHDRRLVRSIL